MNERFPFNEEEDLNAEVSLYIFPHLQEFLAIDTLDGNPRILVFSAGEVFEEAFYEEMEDAFSALLKEPTEYPFAHFMTLPWRVEEMMRVRGLMAVLAKLRGAEQLDEIPRVAVLMMAGPSLSMTSDQLVRTLEHFLGEGADPQIIKECVDILVRFIDQERRSIKDLENKEILQALQGGSQRYFTLWQNPG